MERSMDIEKGLIDQVEPNLHLFKVSKFDGLIKNGDSHSRKENDKNKSIDEKEVAHTQKSRSQEACLDYTEEHKKLHRSGSKMGYLVSWSQSGNLTVNYKLVKQPTSIFQRQFRQYKIPLLHFLFFIFGGKRDIYFS